MKRSLSILVGCLALSPMAMSQHKTPKSVPSEYIVKVNNSKRDFSKSLSSLGVEINQDLKLLSGRFLVVKAKNKDQAILEKVKNLQDVEYAEPNFIYEVNPIIKKSLTNEDDKYSLLWGLINEGQNMPEDNGQRSSEIGIVGADINAEQAWQITKGSPNVLIAVIDTGIDYNHPDLQGNIWINPNEIPGNSIDDDQNGYVDDIHGYNFVTTPTPNPMDGNGHGTHCAGTIGAKHNSIGVAGVMNEVKMMGVKFLSDQGSGSTAGAIQAIDYATKMNVDIMSNSWGGGGYSEALKDAISKAKEKGILFVAAAGNSSSNNDRVPSYPASYDVDNIISVAAHTHKDVLASFSSYGRNSVHVAAPGDQIFSSTPGSNYAVYSGTSMATPHVSGALGLLVAKEGRLPVLEVRERVSMTAVPVNAYRRKIKNGGRLNALNLLTDQRPVRNEPNESDWTRESLSQVYESAHPYANNTSTNFSIKIPGAKKIRLVISRFDTEAGYDNLVIKAKGVEVERISGKGENYATEYAEGDELEVSFKTDSSQTGWGYKIEQVDVIR